MTRIVPSLLLAIAVGAWPITSAVAQVSTTIGAASTTASAAATAATATAQPASAVPTPAGMLAVGQVHPEAASLIDQIMSPFCPGLILTNCPTLAADSLRRAIRARFDAGASRDQVLSELKVTYGEAIRSAPDRSGFGLLAWVVPGSLVLVAGLVLTLFIRRRRDLPLSDVPSTPHADAIEPGETNRALDAALAARLRDG